MELHQYLEVIKKRLGLIIVLPIVCVIISAIVSFIFMKPVYKADIAVLIGQPENKSTTSSSNYQDILMYQNMVKSYAELTKTRRVAEDVIQKLKLDKSADQLLSQVTVAPKANTEFLNISVKSNDKNEAQAIANQLAYSLKEISTSVRNSDNVKIIDEALLPTAPVSPNKKLNMTIALFLGIMIALGIIFLIEYMDTTVKSSHELEELLGVSIIGQIPLADKKK